MTRVRLRDAVALGDGTAPVDLPKEIATRYPFFRIHPDGRRVASSSGAPVWALENFLPPRRAAARGAGASRFNFWNHSRQWRIDRRRVDNGVVDRCC